MTENNNLDYIAADAAIKDFKLGKYLTLDEACNANNAKLTLANIMLGNETIVTEDVFVENSIKNYRNALCVSCEHILTQGDGICNVCACPISVIVNMKFKTCPIGKW